MKKMTLLILALTVCACTAGEFDANRNRLHEMNSDKEICENNPERCINGVAW